MLKKIHYNVIKIYQPILYLCIKHGKKSNFSVITECTNNLCLSCHIHVLENFTKLIKLFNPIFDLIVIHNGCGHCKTLCQIKLLIGLSIVWNKIQSTILLVGNEKIEVLHVSEIEENVPK